MKKTISILSALLLALSLVGCGVSASVEPVSEEETVLSVAQTTEDARASLTEEISGDEAQADTEQDVEQTSESKETEEGGSTMLVAYFSLAGEQYGVGVVEEGNTSIIAHMIVEQTGADLFEIEAVAPYPTTYDELLDVSRQEMADEARPEIAGTVDNMDEYDTIFIGYPNWWGDMPMIVYNFLESYDLTHKTIVPFCTHGGSGLSGTERAIEDITGGSVEDGLAIPGTTAQNDRETAESKVTEWLSELGYIE